MSGKSSITILHVSDTQFGAKHRFGAEGLTAADRHLSQLHTRLLDDIRWLEDKHGLRPDLIVASGDLAETGARSEFALVRDFLTGLAQGLGLSRDRVAMVPGNHDINWQKCRAYFLDCEGDETEPVPPYWPKWDHYAAMFAEFYAGVPGVMFPKDQPWTLYEIPELKTVIAGLNSTMAETHLPDTHYGYCGEEQLRWFAERLRARAADGWLRIGTLHHNPVIQSRDDSAFQRDHDMLAELLAPHLNLILHGHTHAGKLCSFGPEGVPVLCAGSAGVRQDARPEDVPNQYQLIRVKADGVTVYARRYNPDRFRWEGDTSVGRGRNDWTREIRRPLDDVHGTFGTEQDEERHEDSLRKSAYLRDPRTQRSDDLLAKVRKVCEIRYGAECVQEVVVGVDRPQRYLRITRNGPVVSQYPVGACEGPMTADALEEFARGVHDLYRAGDPGLTSFLIYGGDPAPEHLRVQAQLRGVALRSLMEFQGLYDLRPYAQRQVEKLAKSDIYPSELYVPQRFRLISRHLRPVGDATGHDLLTRVQEWVADYDGRFVVVLGDFGHGKTFLLRELARRIHEEQRPPVIPVLIQLRALEKAHGFEEILAAHLAEAGEEKIDLRMLRNLIHEGRVLLLFDGFDELALRVTYAQAARHLTNLVSAAGGRAKVVLTSRTQHFLSEHEVETALASQLRDMSGRRLVKIEAFDEAQILDFLTKLFDGDVDRARARLDLLRDVRDLLGLSGNPRMLGFIARLDEKRLCDIRDRNGEISAAVLYRELLDRWLGFEYERAHPEGAAPALTEAERWKAITTLALMLWETGEETLGIAELDNFATQALHDLAERQITADQAAHMIGSGTLLVRVENERFKFVHRSVLEWLVTNHAAERLRHGDLDPKEFRSRVISDLMIEFLVTLAGKHAFEQWARRTLQAEAGSTTAIAKKNALLALRHMGLSLRRPHDERPPQLAKVNLRGMDLSNADLRSADLREADLREACLDGADLSKSDLRAARLQGCSGKGLKLVGAKLQEADFSTATLIGADLNAAKAAGAIWRRTSLINAVIGPDLGLENTFGAALPDHGLPFLHLASSRHTVSVAMAYSPDGTHLATASDDRTIRIWDPATGTHLRTLEGHTSAINALAYSPDGTHLATAGSDRTIRIWDPATGTHLRTLEGHTSAINALAYSP
ncbi:pentapeptide repeat-containing protein, partial [Thermopolyspora sp. NPDC052614]|uniref:pentapeptide repeat-containing protein n=1 Tax=Thermopolyspora sp. NPDC052614 TaxID=3155682 RepID=UPI00341D0C62